ncbi:MULTISPECIES: ribonuclease HII [Alteromonadaceae]|uniref:ribonuclease HII n=1 Tax=Alteromonadaceae TaxID=72275 RepID=UPI001C082EBC|nr:MULTISPECIES: ribonuclease HII [Aliiglaciecola]MBU2879660.1 ribonuclease HII [Aliiglaciecola lipolytica]MDO6710061.1 ribonuclease HII [Aliiglaciecola sp. 2_MG-2023]MDO6751209.1 ribonuclease HII [Aliiglaciecola sp. 1_MG-2023]
MSEACLIAGVDEVGRGPLVGDVVTAAVILDPQKPILGLNDSKKLSEKKRNVLFNQIIENALCWSVGRASPKEIDQLNILHATMLAMKRAVEGLSIQPDLVQVDGNRCPDWHYASEAIVKGDGSVAEISAASIIAKVTRDREMAELHLRYPEYGFDQHKGYPTKAHLLRLAELGPTEEYRMSFKPVQQILIQHNGVIHAV